MVTQFRSRKHMPTVDRDVFKALADPTRRAILANLKHGGLPAGEIARRFSISRPAISKHLRLLRGARLVMETRSGRNRLYQLSPKPLKSVDDWLDDYRQFWHSQFRNLKRYVE